jgi:hypothetical protein
VSATAVLTNGPRFVGVDHRLKTVSRVATHKSRPPRDPGLPENKNTSSPSNRIDGRRSPAGLLSWDQPGKTERTIRQALAFVNVAQPRPARSVATEKEKGDTAVIILEVASALVLEAC